MPNPPAMPRVTDLLWPTLQAMRDLGGTGTNDEIATRATEIGEFSEDQQAVLQGDGPLTQLDYRLQWARTYLKGMGALENVARAVWALTPRGRDMSESDIPDALREYRQRLEEERRQRQEAAQTLTTKAPRSFLTMVNHAGGTLSWNASCGLTPMHSSGSRHVCSARQVSFALR